jgi:hypothetical protein
MIACGFEGFLSDTGKIFSRMAEGKFFWVYVIYERPLINEILSFEALNFQAHLQAYLSLLKIN